MTSTTVSSGQTSFGQIIAPNDMVSVAAGGTAIATTLSPTVVTHAVVASRPLQISATADLNVAGLARDTVVLGGFVDVTAGGVVSGALVASGGEETINSGGTDRNAIVRGGQIVSQGGVAIGTNVIGGQDIVGGQAIGAVVSGGQSVESGGSTVNTIVRSGGSETINSGGTATGTTVNSGGTLYLSTGGAATATTLAPGSRLDFLNMPYASGAAAALDSSTDILTVVNGGTAV